MNNSKKEKNELKKSPPTQPTQPPIQQQQQQQQQQQNPQVTRGRSRTSNPVTTAATTTQTFQAPVSVKENVSTITNGDNSKDSQKLQTSKSGVFRVAHPVSTSTSTSTSTSIPTITPIVRSHSHSPSPSSRPRPPPPTIFPTTSNNSIASNGSTTSNGSTATNTTTTTVNSNNNNNNNAGTPRFIPAGKQPNQVAPSPTQFQTSLSLSRIQELSSPRNPIQSPRPLPQSPTRSRVLPSPRTSSLPPRPIDDLSRLSSFQKGSSASTFVPPVSPGRSGSITLNGKKLDLGNDSNHNLKKINEISSNNSSFDEKSDTNSNSSEASFVHSNSIENSFSTKESDHINQEQEAEQLKLVIKSLYYELQNLSMDVKLMKKREQKAIRELKETKIQLEKEKEKSKRCQTCGGNFNSPQKEK